MNILIHRYKKELQQHFRPYVYQDIFNIIYLYSGPQVDLLYFSILLWGVFSAWNPHMTIHLSYYLLWDSSVFCNLLLDLIISDETLCKTCGGSYFNTIFLTCNRCFIIKQIKHISTKSILYTRLENYPMIHAALHDINRYKNTNKLIWTTCLLENTNNITVNNIINDECINIIYKKSLRDKILKTLRTYISQKSYSN